MKTTNKLLIVFAVFAMCFNAPVLCQDDAPAGPQYYVITTLHWDMDYDTEDSWEDIEKEYLDKVTMKNEHVMGSAFLVHRWTADNSELRYVQVFADWAAIDLAGARNAELEKEAWPDEAERKAFLKKQGAFYSIHHSDEIYAVMPGAKIPAEKATEDMILYLSTRHFAYPEDGTNEEFDELFKEYNENVTHENDLIKAYYPHAHAWGADRTVFMEAFLLDSMEDVENMGDKNGELIEAHWADEDARKEYFKKMSKYFSPGHGDEIFTAIAGLSK